MMSRSIDPVAERRELYSRPFTRAMRVSTLAWAGALVLSLATWTVARVTLSTPIRLGDALLLAVASLVVSYASLVPALLAGWLMAGRSEGDRSGLGQQQSGLMVAGVMIRLTGTVALFLTCRYQMATPTAWVAAMTIGWYALLTFVDVSVLARELPKPMDGRHDVAIDDMFSRPRPERPASVPSASVPSASVQGFARD
jgi:hypothetical protein